MKIITDWWKYRQQRKQAEELWQAVRKQRRYRQDILSPRDLSDVLQAEQQLKEAIHGRGGDSLTEVMDRADRIGSHLFPKKSWDDWRENVEVLLVAIVAALAIQAYFVKPFKIPTDSMKPTLYGIQPIPLKTDEPFPSWPQRLAELLIMGRSYVHLQTDNSGSLTELKGGRFLPWFEYSDLLIGEKKYRVWVSPATLIKGGFLKERQHYQAGEVVLHFRNDTGDQVLVNKVVYNFRKPHRGEVFVFKTTGIEDIENDLRQQGVEGSQYYIKRCVGIPGDQLRIQDPYLYVNGEVVHSFAFDRVYSRKDGYAGYTNGLDRQVHLSSNEAVYKLGESDYWAMGDNSFHSKDSRFFGPVPRENLVGTALMVYWPFGARWGPIR